METLLSHILRACEGAVIAFRQKALKALASIVEQDPSIFLQEDVREAVEKRLMDSSAAVRDAALEMLGRYVVYRPELAQEYLGKIEERINVRSTLYACLLLLLTSQQDSGLSVRKRVIRLLKSLYPVVEDSLQKASICRRLVGRVYDEDDNVKVSQACSFLRIYSTVSLTYGPSQELAVSTFQDIFLSNTQLNQRIQRNGDDAQSSLAKKREVLRKGCVLMSVAAEFRDRPNPLEDVLRMVSPLNRRPESD